MERSLNTTPIAKHTAAAVKLNRIKTSKNFNNSVVPSTNPIMWYEMSPIINGGTTRKGIISNRT